MHFSAICFLEMHKILWRAENNLEKLIRKKSKLRSFCQEVLKSKDSQSGADSLIPQNCIKEFAKLSIYCANYAEDCHRRYDYTLRTALAASLLWRLIAEMYMCSRNYCKVVKAKHGRQITRKLRSSLVSSILDFTTICKYCYAFVKAHTKFI